MHMFWKWVQEQDDIATNMISRILRESLANMDEETFNLYMKYHYAICERADMVGMTHHSLDIFRKIE